MKGIFLYGTLCYDPLLKLVLGPDQTCERQSAQLAGFNVRWANGADYPVIYDLQDGLSSGVVLTGLSPDQRARLDFYEAGFGYQLRQVSVEIDGKSHAAECYFAVNPPELGPTLLTNHPPFGRRNKGAFRALFAKGTCCI